MQVYFFTKATNDCHPVAWFGRLGVTQSGPAAHIIRSAEDAGLFFYEGNQWLPSGCMVRAIGSNSIGSCRAH